MKIHRHMIGYGETSLEKERKQTYDPDPIKYQYSSIDTN